MTVSTQKQCLARILNITSCPLERYFLWFFFLTSLYCVFMAIVMGSVYLCSCLRAGLPVVTWLCHRWPQSMYCGWMMTLYSLPTQSWRSWWMCWKKPHLTWWEVICYLHIVNVLENVCMSKVKSLETITSLFRWSKPWNNIIVIVNYVVTNTIQ